MTPEQAAEILKRYNAWRRGEAGIEMPDPREISKAIDVAVAVIEAAT